MFINTNIPALNAMRSQNKNQSQLTTSLQRLSSGLRINSAKDDAAGLAISTRMESQVRGMTQARRNVNDAISMVQISEGALGEIGSIIQRGRELAVQAANASASSSDRASLQAEIDQLINEVDRIAGATEFNSVKLFGGGGDTVTYGTDEGSLTPELEQLVTDLKRSWLQQAEAMVDQYFGMRGDGVAIDIKLVEGEPYVAAVSFTGYEVATGKAVNLSMNIDLDDFLPSQWPNGGGSFVSNDRVITHEMVHAIMGRSVNMRDLPLWFIEGTAEFIHGADARLNNDLSATAGTTVEDKLANLMNSYLTADGTAQLYSAGYAAVRYLHQSIIDGGGTGIKEVFDYLEANIGSSLNDAIVYIGDTYAVSYNNQAQLQALFDVGDAGNTYIANLANSGSLNNADTGAVGGADADGGARNTSPDGVVPDISNPSENPLAYFNETFPTSGPVTDTSAIVLATTSNLTFQVGGDEGETIVIDQVGINTGNLGIADVDLVSDASQAISSFDAALNAINSERARQGAVQNRMESVARVLESNIENTSASRSRVLDADFARETAELTRSNILIQAGNAMIAQANSMPNIVLSLLHT